MKKALEHNGVVVQIEDQEFPVHSSLTWHDVDDTVQVGWKLTGGMWQQPHSLNDLKLAQKSKIGAQRDSECVQNVTAHGRPWQADQRSQDLINKAINLALAGLPLPLAWRDADNNDMEITALADLLAIAGAMAVQTQTAYTKSWTLKAQLLAATTQEEIESSI